MDKQELIEMRDKIDRELYIDSKREFEKANETNTQPYAAVIEDEIVVQGDPNNTQVTPRDYKVKFMLPKYQYDGQYEDAKDMGNGYLSLELEYKDIFPSARETMKFTSSIAKLVPFYRKLEENGDVGELSDEEARLLFASISDEIVDAFYHVTGTVLGIEEELLPHLAATSAMFTTSRIINEFPFLAAQAELFSESSTEGA